MMTENLTTTQGILELHPKGFGFLRNPARHYVAQPGDAYVPAPLIQRYSLREGLLVTGPTEPATRGSGPRLMPPRLGPRFPTPPRFPGPLGPGVEHRTEVREVAIPAPAICAPGDPACNRLASVAMRATGSPICGLSPVCALSPRPPGARPGRRR